MYAEKLKYIREEKELKQIDIAKMLQLDNACYGQYEREYTIIPIKHLIFLSDFYNVSIDYIFSFTKILNYDNVKNEIDKNLIGKRLKEFRKENKITQAKLATILNISRTTITEYERGTNIIATPFLYTICKKYGVSADYLLGKIDSPKSF